jgi:hypothetical protein
MHGCGRHCPAVHEQGRSALRAKTISISICILVLLGIPLLEAAAIWIDDGNLVDPGLESWHQELESIATDGSGGAIVSWLRTYYGPVEVRDFICQKIDADGTVLWSSPLSFYTESRGSELASDDAGGAFIVRPGAAFMGWYPLYLSHIHADESFSHITFW